MSKELKGIVVKEKQGFLSSFLKDDANDIGEFIWNEIIKPTMKKLVYDVITDSIGMLLGQDTKSYSKNKYNKYRSYTYYDDYDWPAPSSRYDRFSYGGYEERSKKAKTIAFKTEEDANEVLHLMNERIRKYGRCSIMTLNDLAGVESEYTDEDWGWSNLSTAKIVHTSNGYELRLPKARPFD